MKAKISVLLLSLLVLAFTATDEFSALLKRNNMCFKKPRGVKETGPVKNRRMNYEKAYLDKKKKFEIRYAIRPYDKLIEEYKRAQKDSTFYMIEPNSFYRSSFKSTYLNISSGNEYEYAVFDTLDVKRIFGADWGATATVRPEKEFSANYERCTVIYIFKRNIGEAYYFFLSNDSALLSALPPKYAGTLIFNTSAGKNTK